VWSSALRVFVPGMMPSHKQDDFLRETTWGNSYRLVASDKWKKQSAAMGKAVTEALIDYAVPQEGMKILDLASGTGEPAISLAMRVGPQGQVTALDLSGELLEIAERRAKERGLENFLTKQADAHSLPFADNSFDLATSRFGVMFFRDATIALRELRRVLRLEARACFLAWGPFEQPYWQSMMGVVHRRVGGPLFASTGPDPFRYSVPGSLSEELRAAGFREVQEETRTVPWTWPGTVEGVWEQAQGVAVPFRPMLDRVPPEAWPQIHNEVHEAIGHYVRGSNIEFGATVVLASGRK
jgi:ubiquinone/menaquinone biosynthesis C-methylase UbiE